MTDFTEYDNTWDGDVGENDKVCPIFGIPKIQNMVHNGL